MLRKAIHLLGLTMLLSPAAQSVNASTILVGAPNPLGSFFYGLYSDYAHAAEFTLADSYNVSTIEVMLRTPSTTSFNTFDFSLQDSLT